MSTYKDRKLKDAVAAMKQGNKLYVSGYFKLRARISLFLTCILCDNYCTFRITVTIFRWKADYLAASSEFNNAGKVISIIFSDIFL